MTLSLLLSLSAPVLASEGLALEGLALEGLASESVSRSLPASMPALEIAGDKGYVTVIYDPNATQSMVTATPVRWGEVGCKLDFSGDSTIARAQVIPSQDANTFERCETDWTVVLAGDTMVDVQLKAGKVEVQDTRGRVDVELGRGKLLLINTQGRVDASLGRGKIKGSHHGEGALAVGVGKIKLEGLEQAISARSEVGGVKLTFAETPSGTVVAHAGIGRVRTALPYGATADLRDFDGRLARFRTEVPHRNVAQVRLEGGARLGSTRVDTVVEHEDPDAGVAVVEAP
ncbi:MAG: hypothetical protein ACI9VR_000731 [Cognaticolwellia sp.]|jgi:hypothetical protein